MVCHETCINNKKKTTYHDVHVALGGGLIITLQREGIALDVLGSNDFQDLYTYENEFVSFFGAGVVNREVAILFLLAILTGKRT